MRDELAGELTYTLSDQHSDFFVTNTVALLLEQRLFPGVRYAAYAIIPRHLMDDPCTRSAAESHLRLTLSPWRFADRNPFPRIDLFPLFTRVRLRARRAAKRAVGYVSPRRKDDG